MSILIKGMDMPSSCADCQAYINNGNSCWCVLIDKDICDKGKRDEDCPLVEVKTPHGKLKDADNLKVFSDLWEAPTVIEAEE